MKNLKHYFLWWLIFSGTIIISFIWFATYTNLPTQNNWDPLTATIWNNLINKVNDIWIKVDTLSNIPTWAIMAFNLSSCPTWWVAANWDAWTPDLRWVFIRWLNWSINWKDTSRLLWDYQTDSFQWHNRRISINNRYSPWTKTRPVLDTTLNSDNNNNANITIFQTTNWDYFEDGSYWVPRVSNETRPKNIALLYCMKQ